MTRLKATLAKIGSQLVTIVLIVAALAFVGMFIFQSLRIHDMQDTNQSRKAELAQYQERNTRLQQQLDFLQSPGYMLYVETVARQALGLAKPGETVVLPVPQGSNGTAIRPGTSTVPAKSSPESKPKSGWESWLSFFFG